MTIVVKDKGLRRLDFDEKRLVDKILSYAEGLNINEHTLSIYMQSVVDQISSKKEVTFISINETIIQNAIDFITDFKDGDKMDFNKLGNTDFQFLASRALLNSLYKRAAKNRSYDAKEKYGSYFGLLSSLGEQGLIEPEIFVEYSKEELHELEDYIKPERDLLLTYAGAYNLSSRYLIKSLDQSIYELPQERYMNIAISLMIREKKENRIGYVKELYDALSKQEITMATPIFKNAGRPNAQLSSCFISTPEDDLRSIYDDNTDLALISKGGGGIGTYVGFLRGSGSSIQGVPNISHGITGWLKQLNNTAVSVDQLGSRAGAIAAYLDVFHSDIENFLELRLNTGDQSQRAHELFTGVTLPDFFMNQVEKRGDWYLFDPHEVKTKLGFYLQDFFDKEKWDGSGVPDKTLHAFSYHYLKAVDSNTLTLKRRVPAIDIMKKIMKAQLETGMPYMFYRDTVNRENPNKHAGMIYCSNLCSEITQNQSPTSVIEETMTEDGKIITYKQAGDFVVCNLSSTVINNAFPIDVGTSEKEKEKAWEHLREIVRIQTRATDNTIDINNLPVKQAYFTNQNYRAIGLGEQGVAALLAKLNIPFDSNEATKVIAELERKIMLYAIEASADLAQEKGSYPLFEGSEWNTGEWLGRKENSEDEYFNKVLEKAKKGMRNGFVRAVAPTGSTSLLAGSTSAADTVFDTIFFDGKKDAKTPVVAPSLSPDTWFFYKPTMLMEYEGERNLGHMWAIFHNEERQKWVDQATSFNLYILDDIKASQLLRLHAETWSRGIKTSYYTRSHDATKVDDCVACSA